MHRQESLKYASKNIVLVVVVLVSFLFVGAFWGATAVFSANNTLYASPANQGSADCSNWNNACLLSTAVNQATSGDEIWVEEGIHYPTTSSSDISATIQLANGIALYGGFDGTESDLSERDWEQNLTILSGDIEQNDSTNASGILTNPEDIEGLNSYHLLMAVDVTETAVVDGFTITAGFASSSEPAGGLFHDRGGGVYSQNSQLQLNNITFIGNQAIFAGGAIHSANSDLTIENVHFESNLAIWEGGGLNSTQNSDITINNSTFLNNSTGILDNMATGGAIYHAGSDMIVTNSTFEGNLSSYHGGAAYNFSNSTASYTNVNFLKNSAENGGAVYNRSASPTFNKVIFHANEASEYGGVMYNYFNADPLLNNSLISGNYAALGAAGLFNFFNSDPVLNNVTLSGNLTDGTTGGVDSLQNSNPIIINSIFWNNKDSSGISTLSASLNNPTGTVQNSIIQGSGGSSSWNSQAGSDLGGNLDLDPKFTSQISPNSAPTAAGDYTLQESSPAINAGDNDAYDQYSLSTTDLAGNTRIQNSLIDIGAYESMHSPSSYPLTVSLSGTGSGQIYLDGEALSCDNSCTVDMDPDTAITLTATPDANSLFEGWSGDCSGTGSCALTMDSPKSVSASFVDNTPPPSYPLSIEIIGSGDGELFLDGSPLSCSSSCTLEFLENTEITLTADPDTGSTFAGWGGACEGDGTCVITMSSPKEVTANFNDNEVPILYPLSIEVVGSGEGQLFLNGSPLVCNGNCTVNFDADTAVTLTASPLQNSTFVGWSGDCQGTGLCNLVMNSAKAVTVNFVENGEPVFYPLSIDLIGSGNGQIFLDGNPLTCNESCTVELEEDTAVTLTASPDGNSLFAGWGEDCEGAEICTLTMNAAKTVSASFIDNSAPVSYSLSIMLAGMGDGQLLMNGDPLSCDGGCTLVLDEETVVVLTASPEAGSLFAGWSGNCAGTDSCNLTMNSAKQVSATFDVEGISNTEFMIYLPIVVK